MKVNIVNYEQGQNDGILTKFAVKLDEELKNLDVESYITQSPDGKADVTHHINYLPYKHENSINSLNSLMITHIWRGYKFNALKKGMETADIGICMSKDTEKKMVDWGLPEEKLATVLPAHDGKPRRHQIVAILTNVYPDGCKKEGIFEKLAKNINHDQWAFRIMGSGWENILPPLVANGLQVDYFHKFNYDVHQKILESSDYALYFGEDEGSMGLLDAKNAGLKTIGTKQGFHIEMELDYYFNGADELIKLFNSLNKNNVKDWTWDKYAKDHLKIWKEKLKTQK